MSDDATTNTLPTKGHHMNAIAIPSNNQPNTPAITSQASAIEQARAVAEVQAAVTVAQNMPRNTTGVEAEMVEACSRMALAERAFYSVPNRGNGPSVHLARELIAIWGNTDSGVRELRRDDEAGVSEMIAFAWDQQRNTRNSRSFIQPHEKSTKAGRKKLTDLNDIYLSNQNTGARALRECIFSTLPAWFTEQAQTLCRQTLERGDGEPLETRVAKMVEAFDKIGVSADRLESKIGRSQAAWLASDVAQMKIAYTSVTRDGLNADDEFPAQRVTIADITPAQPESLALETAS
jgi:hypothetical protein